MSLGNTYTNFGPGGKVLYSGNDANKATGGYQGQPNPYQSYDSSGGLAYSGNNQQDYYKSLGSKGAGAGSAASPGIASVQMPSWMSKNPDANLQELLGAYNNLSSAFDPSAQVQARNDAIGYNTSVGGQAANNAATEYSNRASQSGGSQLGAGVVKAQAMMPVLQQNAKLKGEAADIAAKTYQDGASLASQIAGTIGSLRSSYLSALTGFATDQQKMQQQNNQFNAGLQLDRNKFNYAQQQDQANSVERRRQIAAAARQQEFQNALATMQVKPPNTGNYNTDMFGQGMTPYDTRAMAGNQNFKDTQQNALSRIQNY
jgi:hypothetical protein